MVAGFVGIFGWERDNFDFYGCNEDSKVVLNLF